MAPAKLNKEEAKVQAASMLAKRVLNSTTHQEIARLFGCSPDMVRKRLQLAASGDLQQMAKDIITERMLPQALTLLEQNLQAGNYDAAKDVLYGLQVLQKGGTAKIEHITSSTPTLDQIRKERQKAIDAEVINTPDDSAQS